MKINPLLKSASAIIRTRAPIMPISRVKNTSVNLSTAMQGANKAPAPLEALPRKSFSRLAQSRYLPFTKTTQSASSLTKPFSPALKTNPSSAFSKWPISGKFPPTTTRELPRIARNYLEKISSLSKSPSINKAREKKATCTTRSSITDRYLTKITSTASTSRIDNTRLNKKTALLTTQAKPENVIKRAVFSTQKIQLAAAKPSPTLRQISKLKLTFDNPKTSKSRRTLLFSASNATENNSPETSFPKLDQINKQISAVEDKICDLCAYFKELTQELNSAIQNSNELVTIENNNFLKVDAEFHQDANKLVEQLKILQFECVEEILNKENELTKFEQKKLIIRAEKIKEAQGKTGYFQLYSAKVTPRIIALTQSEFNLLNLIEMPLNDPKYTHNLVMKLIKTTEYQLNFPRKDRLSEHEVDKIYAFIRDALHHSTKWSNKEISKTDKATIHSNLTLLESEIKKMDSQREFELKKTHRKTNTGKHSKLAIIVTNTLFSSTLHNSIDFGFNSCDRENIHMALKKIHANKAMSNKQLKEKAESLSFSISSNLVAEINELKDLSEKINK